MLATPSPLVMPAWYPLQLNPWQLGLNYLNLATELSGDSVAQLVRAWQAINLPGHGFKSLPESLPLSFEFQRVARKLDDLET